MQPSRCLRLDMRCLLSLSFYIARLGCPISPLSTGQEVRAMPSKLFVGNLSFQATEEDLRELFAQSGTVETVRIITDQFTGRPRGFGFVEMGSKEEATKAIEMLNGRLFRDRNLVVDEARPQPQRGPGGGDRPRGPRPSGGP